MVTTVLTILGSVIASLAAVVLAAHLQQRLIRSEQRRAAYEGFLTSAGIVQGRATLLLEASSLGQVISASFMAMGPVVASLLVWWKWEREFPTSELASSLANATRSVLSYQTPLEQTAPYSLILEAIEDLQRQALKVQLLSSADVSAACQDVIDHAVALLEVAESRKKLMPFRMKDQRIAFQRELEEMRSVKNKFAKLREKKLH